DVIKIAAHLDPTCRGEICGGKLSARNGRECARKQARLERVSNRRATPKQPVGPDRETKLQPQLLEQGEVEEVEGWPARGPDGSQDTKDLVIVAQWHHGDRPRPHQGSDWYPVSGDPQRIRVLGMRD